jgi:hypothetical protein
MTTGTMTYTIERTSCFNGIRRALSNVAVLSSGTQWVIFNTKDFSIREIEASALQVGKDIGHGLFHRELVLCHMSGYLVLIKKNKHLPGDPYAINVGKHYDIDGVYNTLLQFTNDNPDFIASYNSTNRLGLVW